MHRYPGLQVVGTECPSLQRLVTQEEVALIVRIRAAKPDILLVAFGQPKGERWIHRHVDELSVPVSIQVGASLDFAAGMIRRAPALDAENWSGVDTSAFPARAPTGFLGGMPVMGGSWPEFSVGISSPGS